MTTLKETYVFAISDQPEPPIPPTRVEFALSPVPSVLYVCMYVCMYALVVWLNL